MTKGPMKKIRGFTMQPKRKTEASKEQAQENRATATLIRQSIMKDFDENYTFQNDSIMTRQSNYDNNQDQHKVVKVNIRKSQAIGLSGSFIAGPQPTDQSLDAADLLE